MRLERAILLAAPWTGCGSTGDAAGPDTPGSDGAAPGTDDDASTPPSGNFTGGLGAIPFDGGVSFRVWAPNADQVFVSGDFNQWSDSATPMQLGAGGVFGADVAGATVGQGYQYLVHHAGQVLTRQDPRARAVTGPQGNSLIVDPTFAWTTPADWKLPPVEERVIYELHVGTFNPPAGTVAGTLDDNPAATTSLRPSPFRSATATTSAPYFALPPASATAWFSVPFEHAQLPSKIHVASCRGPRRL